MPAIKMTTAAIAIDRAGNFRADTVSAVFGLFIAPIVVGGLSK